MRSDHTAHHVATRAYRDASARTHALTQHTKRVMKARRIAPDSDLAKQPMLTASGAVIFSAETAECGIGHLATVVFKADSETHRITDRSGERCTAALCVRHWSELARDENDDTPVTEVRFTQRPPSGGAAT